MKVVDRVGSARFIIDDGSHQPVHQYETFNFLLRTLLEPDGVYITEFSGRNNDIGVSSITYGQNCIIITFDRAYRFQHLVDSPGHAYVPSA